MSTVEVVQRICGYEVHEAADAFPMMGEDETKSLVEDIKENGQIHACIRFEGKILDGRNRAKACEILGIAPKFEEAPEGCNPWNYVVSANAERRELEPFLKTTIRLSCLAKSQAWSSVMEAKKAEANAARSRSVSEARSIQNRSKSESGTISAETTPKKPEVNATSKQLAKDFGVSQATVVRALELQKKDPEAFEKVRTGEIKGRDAWNEMKAREPKKEKSSPTSVGLVAIPDCGHVETDIEVDGAFSITTGVVSEPVKKPRYGKVPDLDVSILNQAKDFSYAWELMLGRDGFQEQWAAVPEAQKLVVIDELNRLKKLTQKLLKRMEGTEL